MSPVSRYGSLVNGSCVEEARVPRIPMGELAPGLSRACRAGMRLAALMGAPSPRGGATLWALLADDGAGRLYAAASEAGTAYPSLTPELPQAHLFEREIRESLGVAPEGHPWLKAVRAHGGAPHPFFRVEGSEVHEVAVGPVHAGVIEPGHFRFQCHGETVLHLEIRFGYQRRGALALLRGGPDRRSACVAESIAGDSVVAHATAYCRVLEALGDAPSTLRGEALRAAALELERVANHVGDLGALSGDIAYQPAAAWFGRLRGEFLNSLMELSGNRYGRGLVRPGGAAFDVDAGLAAALVKRLKAAHNSLEGVAELFFAEPSVVARLEGVGVVGIKACRDLGFVGPTARACGVGIDARQDHPAGFYRFRHIPVMTAGSGDVHARALMRWLETQRSLEFLIELLGGLPAGAPRRAVPAPRPGRMAVALVEGWRGEVLHAAFTGSDGRFADYKIVDPSFKNWAAPGLAMRGGEISDFPLCNKSFNLSYAGHDL